jgi:hypothetical protein
MMAEPVASQCVITEDFTAPVAGFSNMVAVGSGNRMVTSAGHVLTSYQLQNGTLVEEQTIQFPSSYTPNAQIALDGEWLAAGSLGTNGTGHVEMYRLVNGVWTFFADVLPATLGNGSQYGRAVSLSGNRLLAAAPLSGANGLGKVHLFEFDGAAWQESAVLKAPIREDLDLFGLQALWDGDRAVITCPGKETVYTFSNINNLWQLSDEMVPTQGTVRTLKGIHLSEVGLFVSATELGNPYNGLVYQYEPQGGGWLEVHQVAAPPGAIQFGTNMLATTTSGGEVLLVANLGFSSGAIAVVHLFRMRAGSWREVGMLTDSNQPLSGSFGEALVANQDRLYAWAGFFDRRVEFPIPDVACAATPTAVQTGDTWTIEACGGAAGQPYVLFVTAVDQIPVHLRTPIAGLLFSMGEFSQSLTIPSEPVLDAGVLVEFQLFSLDPAGGIWTSNKPITQFN